MLNGRYRNSFYTLRRRIKLIQRRFDYDTYMLFKHKELFNKKYNRFLGREWFYLDNEKELMRFEAFLSEHKEIIVKPIDGHCGEGVIKISLNDMQKKNEIVQSVHRGATYICEEVVYNDKSLAMLNPTSLNTLRVNTMVKKDGTPVILDCLLRVGGKDSVVDNLNGGGIAYPVSMEGFIDHYGVDNRGNEFSHHPSTNVKMIGLEIPRFDELKSWILNVAKEEPKARLVGWDVAITDSEFVLIEGNMGSGEDAMQRDGLGKYKYIINNW